MTYSEDTRRSSLEMLAQWGPEQLDLIAQLFSCSTRSIRRWKHDLDHGLPWAPQRHREAKAYSCVLPLHFEFVRQKVFHQPFSYLSEISAHVFDNTGWWYTEDQVRSSLDHAGFTHRVLEFRAMEQVAEERMLFVATRNQFRAEQFVVANETHCAANDVRRKCGFGLRGVPAFVHVYNSAHGYGNPASALCAMSTNGMISVSVTEEKMNAQYFLRELEDSIHPAMHPYQADESVLLLDNASTHDHLRIAELCQRFGVLCIFLPRFGYDLSPIEPAFHEVKAYIRRKYGLADGIVRDRLQEACWQVPPQHAVNYFRHCGFIV